MIVQDEKIMRALLADYGLADTPANREAIENRLYRIAQERAATGHY